MDLQTVSSVQGGQELGLSQWKAQVLAALKVGAGEFRSIFLKVSLIAIEDALDVTFVF